MGCVVVESFRFCLLDRGSILRCQFSLSLNKKIKHSESYCLYSKNIIYLYEVQIVSNIILFPFLMETNIYSFCS